jgi:hypothetical protein
VPCAAPRSSVLGLPLMDVSHLVPALRGSSYILVRRARDSE